MKKGPPVTTDQSWQELYAAAMLELDLVCLAGRIEAAQAAIRQAMKELAGAPERITAEMQEMSSALGNLQTLQRVTLRGSQYVQPEFSSDRGAAYATLVPQENGANLAQTAVSDDGTASSCESRNRSEQAGTAVRQSCDA
jgi:hypothetical protein